MVVQRLSTVERGPAGFSLSAAGKTLRRHAQKLLQQAAVARQAVHELRPEFGGALPIAASLSICTCLLPEELKSYQARIRRLSSVRAAATRRRY
jgi:DNA-binding transcriptional LysR family regulator